jgi:hypothetical protein
VEKERSEREERVGENEKEKRGGGALVGTREGLLQFFAGMNSAWLSCEARFEILNPAWLRAIFRIRSAVLRWADSG